MPILKQLHKRNNFTFIALKSVIAYLEQKGELREIPKKLAQKIVPS